MLFIVCTAGFSLQCSDSESPALPSRIEIFSGDNQFSKFGTELLDPLVVKVKMEDGSPAGNITVVFQPTSGGNVSRSRAITNQNGTASTRFTLGPTEGIYEVRASIDGMSDKSVIFNATASYAFCPEAETTMTISFGPQGYVLFGTPKSSVFPTHTGVVRINPSIGGSVSPLVGFIPGLFTRQVWDIALSPRGDLYVASSEIFDEILKVAPDGSYSRFGPLGDFHGLYNQAEIAYNPSGLIVGCNNKGPFFVTCGDSLMRFPQATYSGEINNDAVAVDPITEDIYFIHQDQQELLRLPVDTMTATGPPEIVASLTVDEATGARGMVCDTDRMIYIIVDTDNTKKILSVSAVDGTKSDLFDFFSRGSGTAADAGIPRELALDQNNGYLYTVDTLNNQLLLYNLPSGPLEIRTQGPQISTTVEGGERIGLAVIR